MPVVALIKCDARSIFSSIREDENSVKDIEEETGSVAFSDTNNGSTFDLLYKSCGDYSSRVWNVVKADMGDHLDELNSKKL